MHRGGLIVVRLSRTFNEKSLGDRGDPGYAFPGNEDRRRGRGQSIPRDLYRMAA